jgi:NADH-quinone oxidoreductase subunit J
MGNLVLFILFAFIAIVAAVLMITSRNAVYSALFLVLNFVTIAVMYLTLNAPFIAMVQITVYAGAIMVLFLFVIMLLGAEKLLGPAGDARWYRVAAILLALLLVVGLASALVQGVSTEVSDGGTFETGPASLGLRLFEAYVFPFELTGVLLLVAMIGVVVLSSSKKRGSDA